MKKKTHGFIFLMTLLVTSVISLLVLASMQHILLYYKAVNKQAELHQRFYQMEQLALELVHAPNNECVLHQDSANTVIQRLKSYQGCAVQHHKIQYYYLIEDLGLFPCLTVQQKRQKKSSVHRRISLIQRTEDQTDALLQLRFISSASSFSCEGVAHEVQKGVSSWRYLAAMDEF